MPDQIDFSKYGGSSVSATPDSSSIDFSKYASNQPVNSPATSDTSGIDFSKYSGAQATDQPSDSPWKGIFNNPISNFVGGATMGALNGLGDVIHTTEQLPLVKNVVGAFNGAVSPIEGVIQQLGSPEHAMGWKGIGQDFNALGGALLNEVPSILHGAINPDQQLADYQQKISTLDPLDRLVAGAGADPASYVPLGPIVKGLGLGVKGLSDLTGASPYIAKAADAVANAPFIKPAIQGTQDVVGNMFTKYYDAKQSLIDMINNTKGTQAVNQDAILSSLSDLSQGHNLTPDELNQIGHVVEGTMQGTPEQQAFAQQWSNAAFHGPESLRGNGASTLPNDIKIGDTVNPTNEAGHLISENPVKVTNIQTDASGNKWYQTELGNSFFPEGQVSKVANEPSSTIPDGAIGTNAMLHTASAVNGEPILQNQIPNHFTHLYDNVPSDLQGVFPKTDYSNGSGLSPDGTFNKPRTYDTLQEAQANGLKPVLNPLQVLGHQWKQSSDALTNNSLLQQVKNEPNLLLPKDKLDELYKLVKTGRMDSPQVTSAMQQLGLTAKDLKPGGIVQSQVPQLSGYYIRKADEAALQEHLNPTQATGANKVAQGAENLYNKGYLLNPIPHLHNIGVNGVVLGGAKIGDIMDTMKGIKNGTEPMYQRALKAGAISNPVVGKFSDAVDRAIAPKVNPFVQTGTALKDLVTTKPTGVGDVVSKLKSVVQPTLDASHNLLWKTNEGIGTTLFKNAVNSGMTDAQAAAHTNKFMVDYNNVTPFEKQYLKPLIPFYAWKKGNLPLQLGQTLAQTPKYAAWNNAKNAASQMISGQLSDQKGRINSGQQLSDGSTTMVDPYNPMDDISKIGQKGILPYLYNSLSPAIHEGINQGSSLAQFFGAPIQNKFPIYNSQAPLGWNLRSGLAHAANALNPLSGSAIAGEAGSQSNLVNRMLGMPTNNKPNQTQLETAAKLLGGFTARSNPATDAKNQYYQTKQNQLDLRKYMKVEAKVNANK